MIQDIEPQIFKNQFYINTPDMDDYFFYYQDGKILLKKNQKDSFSFAKFQDFKENFTIISSNSIFSFSISDKNFYLVNEKKVQINSGNGYGFYDLNIFQSITPKWIAFAGITGSQLYRFYRNRTYCGRCGNKMLKKTDERALICPVCHVVEYPKISPAIIIGIKNGNKILMSKYARGNQERHSLLAGFVEFGETLEQTVRREVMEEVGLKVKNIRYYGSQPWSFSDSLMIGFFADLDGSPQIHIDSNELAAAEWFERSEIPDDTMKGSIAHEMIEAFRIQLC